MSAPDPASSPTPPDAAQASPRYADPDARAVGERLLELFEARRARPDDPALEQELRALRHRLRQGPLLQPGEIVADRFRLLHHLRDGPLAATWRGWDLEQGGPVAIKVLHARFLTDPEVVAQFFDAAAKMAALSHPAAPGVRLARGDYEGFLFFVTDAHGESTLQRRVQEGLGPWAAVQAVIEAGQALSAAHHHELFHRALNPETIYVAADGSAWLTDFQLAPDASNSMGSVYDAPEIMEPGARFTARADVYSLGMTLLFALHNQPLPFWVMRGPDRLIQQLDCPDSIKEALGEALRWEPEARTATVDAFLEAITASPVVIERLAEAAAQAGRHALAIDHYRSLLDQDAPRPELRTRLARALTAQGELREASEQLHLALHDPQLGDPKAALAELRALSEQTGDWIPLCEVLSRRAEEPQSPRDALLLEVARIRADHTEDLEATEAAWQAALEAHTTREQARTALQGLLAVHSRREDHESFIQTASALLPLLERDEKGALKYQVAQVCLGPLDDPLRGLMWLERAQLSGVEEPELLPALIRLRTARGDWEEVVRWMAARAAAQSGPEAVETLREAARIARFTRDDAETTASLYSQLQTHPDAEGTAAQAEATHWLAPRVADADALQHLARLPEAPAEDRPRWIADTWRRASLLHAQGEQEASAEVLSRLLAEEPSHLAGLHLQGQISLANGDLDGAAAATSRLLGVIAGAELPELVRRARLTLSDLACYRGALHEARRHLDEAPDADPIEAGWRTARVALWAACQPEAYPAWLKSTPPTFTPHEALARLLAGLLDPEAIRAWASRDPLGAALARHPILRGPEARLPLAGLAVDLLVRADLIGPGLFERLADAFPEAVVYIETVRWLWCEAPADDVFPVADSYQWDPGPMGFDPAIPREVLHLDPPLRADRASPHPLARAEAWAALLARTDDRALPIESAQSPPAPHPALPAPEAIEPLLLTFDPPLDTLHQLVIDGPALDLGPEGLGGETPARLLRCGDHLYVVGEGIALDGQPRPEARLGAGSTVTLNGRILAIEPAGDPTQPGHTREELAQIRREAEALLPLDADEDLELDLDGPDDLFDLDDAAELAPDDLLELEPSSEEVLILDGDPADEAFATEPAPEFEVEGASKGSDEPLSDPPPPADPPAPPRAEDSYDEVLPDPLPADDPAERTSPHGDSYDDATEIMARASDEPSSDDVPTLVARPAQDLSGDFDDLDLADFFAEEDDSTLDTLDLSDPVGIELDDDEDPPALATDPLGRHAVVIRKAGDSEEVLPFVDDLFIIGRNPADDIFVESPGTGFLYQLHRRGDTYVLEEALTGGTSEERPLNHGDTLHVEGMVLTFQMIAFPPQEPEAPRTSPSPAARITSRPPQKVAPSSAPTVDPAPARTVISPPPARPEPSPRPAPPRRKLPLLVEVSDDESRRTTHLIQRNVYCIGRGRKNDLQLVGDGKISRLHCTLVHSDDGVLKIRDNGSSNGTFVNDRKVTEQILQVGDIIGVGDHRFEFRLGSHDEPPRKVNRAEAEAEGRVATAVAAQLLPDDDDDLDRTLQPSDA